MRLHVLNTLSVRELTLTAVMTVYYSLFVSCFIWKGIVEHSYVFYD